MSANDTPAPSAALAFTPYLRKRGLEGQKQQRSTQQKQ
jgi:hypothetical protein